MFFFPRHPLSEEVEASSSSSATIGPTEASNDMKARFVGAIEDEEDDDLLPRDNNDSYISNLESSLNSDVDQFNTNDYDHDLEEFHLDHEQQEYLGARDMEL